jgi:hypothetical protein
MGAIYQATLGRGARHARGAHFTAEREILRVVEPSLVRPWQARIDAAATAAELSEVHAALLAVRVLDPACGSGDFLCVAYREMRKLEARILARLCDAGGPRPAPSVGLRQLSGIDIDPLAVELARVTLLLAEAAAGGAPDGDPGADLVCADALFCAWPPADVILGNPPFQAKNKASRELGTAYVAALRERWPGVPGRADYCVYWFRRAHDELRPGGRAGLVGTNTVRQGDSRRGGLDHIVRHGGTITEAVSTQAWPGEAVVHVSIVNWIKGDDPGDKILWVQEGDDPAAPLRRHVLPRIHAALSPCADVTGARPLACNEAPKTCFQGQTPGHAAFVVGEETAAAWIRAAPSSAGILFPYLVGDDLLDDPESAPRRRILDFGALALPEARRHALPFAHVAGRVAHEREAAAAAEDARNAAARSARPGARVNRHHRAFVARWWLPSYRREDMLAAIAKLSRYIACSRVTRRPIFEIVPSAVRPGDALQVFALEDDYSFGVLQSSVHWRWFVERCSGLKVDPRYTSATVYASFPWPQAPSARDVGAVAEAARAFREQRRACARALGAGLRAVHRQLDRAGDHPLKALLAALDAAVRRAYGMDADEDALAFLLRLNAAVAARLDAGEPVRGPGCPRDLSPCAIPGAARPPMR